MLAGVEECGIVVIMGKRSTKPAEIKAKGFNLGRAGFAQISAVEGIFLTPEMKRDFKAFDAKGLSDEERRRAIINKYGKRSA